MRSRSLLHPLRSLLVKLHPYFSCCASCGEIKTPLEGRLCTSLSPNFPVDGLLLGGTAEQAGSLKRSMPWLRRVHTLPRGTAASLLDLPDLAEHCMAAFADARLDHIRHPLDLFTPNGIPLLAARRASALSPVEDTFCAFLEERGLASAREASFISGVYALTRECLEGFAAFAAELTPTLKTTEDLAALSRWAYASALAIPAGPLHPLLRHG